MTAKQDTTLPVEFQEVATICAATEVVIGGRSVIGVDDHRKLHAGLQVGRDHTNWIKGRIDKYRFRDGVDFEVLAEMGENPEGGRPAKIYRLTLDMAKELAMVENNETGRTIRRYFIWAENRAHQAAALTAKETGGIVKAVVGKALADLKAEFDAEMADQRRAMIEQSKRIDDLIITHDSRRAVVDRVSVRQLLDEVKCASKGRNGLNRRIGNALKHLALIKQPPVPVRKCPHSGVWLYPIDFAAAFMRDTGNAWVTDHNANVIGQGVLNFKAEKAKRDSKPKAPASENPEAPL